MIKHETWWSEIGGAWVEQPAAWYVAPMRLIGSFGQFVLDVKIGADLGYSWPSAVSFAWKIWGWRA